MFQVTRAAVTVSNRVASLLPAPMSFHHTISHYLWWPVLISGMTVLPTIPVEFRSAFATWHRLSG
jgi:hypothetical protein